MWRISLMLAALGVALLPITAAAAPEDRAGQLTVAPEVQIARQAQEVSALEAQLLSVSGERDQLRDQVGALQGQRDTLQRQIDALQGQLGARGAGVGAGPSAVPLSAPGVNRFAFGYCTWYVANRRYVPWMGNAIDWWPNARVYGFAEGQTPRVGAIMVSAESGWGHVAYVEAVGAGGSFTVSEMNWSGWDVVDWRVVAPGRVPVLGFIYG